MKKIYILTLLLNAFFFGAQAQSGFIHNDINQVYLEALELFKDGQYMNAQRKFEMVVEELPMNAELAMNAQYYASVCGLELIHKEADDMLIRYLDQHPHSNKSQLARFQLGRYYFQRKNHKEVIKWMTKVDKYDLNSAELEEYYFKLGYSYFALRKKDSTNIDKAQMSFYEVKSNESVYSELATYYHSHILYFKGKYESALQGFIKIKDSETLKGIVPYYITQIYYHQGKHDELIEYGIPLLSVATTKRSHEISRMIGEAYYRTSRYKEAIPYLETYVKKKVNILPEDYYQLAYAQYQAKFFKQAAYTFERLASTNDKLGQLSYYYLGDIYLKLEEKEKARIAFKFSSSVDFDPELSENSLFNYAKLAYDLYDPYQEAIRSFELFLEKYPNSERRDEAYKILLDVYVNTKNYTQALKALDKIELKDLKLRRAYQNIAYSRGVELFNDQKRIYHEQDEKYQNLKAAIYYFTKSLEYPEDAELVAKANFWIAESYYKQGDYLKAIDLYSKFKYSPGTSGLDETEHIDYNLGYSYYQIAFNNYESNLASGTTQAALRIHEFEKGIEHFRKYTKQSVKDSIKLNDAYLRIGDAYFVQKNWEYAVDFYEEALKIDKLNSDYGLMQMAQAHDFLEDSENTILVLSNLVSTYPESRYLDDAYFILGETHFDNENLDKAKEYYQILIDKKDEVEPQLVQSSYIRMALISYQNQQYQVAIDMFKSAVEIDPRNEVSQQAMKGIQEAYTKIGDVQPYYAWYESLGLPPVSDLEKDEFLFEVGREQYLDNKLEEAVGNFQTYIDQFPNGQFILEVNYFKADCHLTLKQYEKALVNYDFVTEQPLGDYTEDAVLQSARIHLMNKDWDNVIHKYLLLEDISDYYPNRLEARIGLMRAYYETGNNDNARAYAHSVANNNKVPNEVRYEAHLTMGRCYFNQEIYDKALAEFETTVSLTKSEMGAEAKYHIALIQHLKGDYDASKATIIELAKQIPAYKYWITKGFILLSDNYLAVDDLFHAKHTLKMVLDNETNEELRNIALLKMEEIEQIEADNQITEVEDDWIIDFEEEESDSTGVINEDNMNE